MNHIKDLIIEDLDKLSTHELGKVYKFIRTELIAEIPDRKGEWSKETLKKADELNDNINKLIAIRKELKEIEKQKEEIEARSN